MKDRRTQLEEIFTVMPIEELMLIDDVLKAELKKRLPSSSVITLPKLVSGEELLFD